LDLTERSSCRQPQRADADYRCQCPGAPIGRAINHLLQHFGTLLPHQSAQLGVLPTPLPVICGGTGQTAYTNGQLLIGDTGTGGLDVATITAGSGISVTNGAGTITIANTGGTERAGK
jgi:hypothetical protein